MEVDESPIDLGVYIIADREDADRVDELKERLEKQNMRCECQYDIQPAATEGQEFDDKLDQYDRILLIISQHSQMSKWIMYCQAVLADKKPTVPLVIDRDLEIEQLDCSIQRLVCLKVADKNYFPKLCKSLKSSHNKYCLPIAPIHPGICANFFYGFLNIVLPDFDQCLQKWEKERGVNVVPKMLIVIPESCECKPHLRDYALEYVKLYPDDTSSRVECAKNQLDASRCYDQYVYEITNPDAPGEKYHAVLVLCATMHALYEMKQNRVCGIDENKMRQERKCFEEMLAKLLERHKRCSHRADVVSFDDSDSDNQKAFVDPIIKKCREIMKSQKSA